VRELGLFQFIHKGEVHPLGVIVFSCGWSWPPQRAKTHIFIPAVLLKSWIGMGSKFLYQGPKFPFRLNSQTKLYFEIKSENTFPNSQIKFFALTALKAIKFFFSGINFYSRMAGKIDSWKEHLDGLMQGCQMVYFQTKNPNLGKFWSVLQWKMSAHFMAIRSILPRFGIFYGHFIYFVVIW
jgi:hypothetical protein